MRFGLYLFPYTLDEYLENIGKIASSPHTLVFLDTNILAYLYKLHAAARKEFFVWAKLLELGGRLCIPAWAATEYLVKVKAGNVSDYGPSGPKQVLNSLQSLHETASLFVDENSLKGLDLEKNRTDFLDGFQDLISKFAKYTSVFKHQFDPWVVHHEITSNLSACILHSDLATLCSRAAAEGDARNAHRLPPGYKDSSKAENKYGDLIIWYEILDHVSKMNDTKTFREEEVSQHVILVTNDEKSDWVYAPTKRHGEVKGRIGEVNNINPAIRIPDPRLIAEFRFCVAHENIHIISFPMLIRALSIHQPKEFENLASAIQIETGNQPEAPESEIEEKIVPMVDNQQVAPPVSAFESSAQETSLSPLEEIKNDSSGVSPAIPSSGIEYGADALRDSAFEANAPSKINEVIRALKSHNWYLQNPAFREIREIRNDQFKPDQWFVLGRNIYQAACGNAQKALEFLKNLDIELSRFSQETAIHLLNGMLFEIYFDGDGNFRKRPKAAHIEQTMREVTKECYEDSKTALLSKLAPFNDLVPFKPGDTRPVPLDIKIVEAEAGETKGTEGHKLIQSVSFLDQERLCDVSDKDDIDDWNDVSHPSKITANQIRSRLSQNYAIPEWAINVQLSLPDYANKRLAIPEGKVLKLDRFSCAS